MSQSWFQSLSTSIVQATTKVTEAIRPSDETSRVLNNISSTVRKSAQQFKQIVEEQTILANFSKEHEKFLVEKKVQQRREDDAVPPWVGYREEEEMKKEILKISQDRGNFVREPPLAANYQFDMVTVYPVALATLEVDENLRAMRFELVPKQLSEEIFWRNYFYRVNLAKQSTQINTPDNMSDLVSEEFDTSALDVDQIRREIEQSNAIKKTSELDESEWDQTLSDELDRITSEELENISPEELDAQINQMLADENK